MAEFFFPKDRVFWVSNFPAYMSSSSSSSAVVVLVVVVVVENVAAWVYGDFGPPCNAF